jgi:hypothetical protein
MTGQGRIRLAVGQALASRTYAELAAITADLPAGLTAAPSPKPAGAPSERPVLQRPGPVLTAATVLFVGMWPLAFFLPRTSGDGAPLDGLNLVGVATFVYLLVLVSACVWAQMLGSRQEKRPGGAATGAASTWRGRPGTLAPASSRSRRADPAGRAWSPADR